MTGGGCLAGAVASPSGIRAAALSDVGASREQNEDAFATVPDLDLYVVSDGMGGRAAGETAARIVVEALPELLRERLLTPDLGEGARRELLRRALLELSASVRREAARWVGRAGMGATVVVASAHGGRATIAHMGDSRAYRYHAGRLDRLTRDHSVTGILVERGELTEEEARTHPARGTITRYVGMEGSVDPDLTTVGLEPDDRIVLCSDGLWGVVADDVVARVLARTEGDPEAACRGLIDAAHAAGAPDNVTVLVADRDRRDDRDPLSPAGRLKGAEP